MQDAAAIAGRGQSTAALGPLEAVHLRSRNYRNAADSTRITPITLLVMAAIIWFYSPEHARKKLDAISV